MPISRADRNPVVLPPNPVSHAGETQPTTTQPTSPGLTDMQNRRWDLDGAQGPDLSPAVRTRSEAAVNTFHDRLRTILHHDAMSLAEGHTPVRSGDTLTPGQQGELTDAAKDMLMDMPIGALSPQMTGELRSYLDRQGVSADNLETKTLGDLGDVGGDLAKKWADDLKDSTPAAYYGLLGAAGAAVGAYGYLQGSEALKDLGIKPEVKTSLFGDHIKVRAEAMWERRFRNPNLNADINGTYRLNDLTFRGNLNVDTRNLDATHGGAGVRWGTNATHLDAEVNASVDNGLDTIRLSGRYTGDNYYVHGNATFTDDFSLRHANMGGGMQVNEHLRANMNVGVNSDGDIATIDANARYDRDDLFVRGRVRADLINDNHAVDVWGGYRPTDNFEVGVRGGYSNRTGGRVGVGVTWNF